MSIFKNFACHLTNGNWWFMWGALLLAALLGLWLGYLIWGRKLKALLLEHGKLQTAFDELQAKYNALLEKYTTLEGHYKRSQDDLVASNNRVRTLENEKGQLYGDLMLAKTDLDKSTNLLDAIKADKANMDDALGLANTNLGDRDTEIDSLKAALAACQKNKGGNTEALAKANATIADRDAETASLKAALATCQKDKGGNTEALAKANATIADRDAEITRLKAAGVAAAAAGAGAATVAAGAGGAGSTGYKMKLQVIEGIGAKREEILHKNGINSYADLANASAADICGFYAGTTFGPKPEDAEEWRKQAKMAADGKWGNLHDYQLGIGGGNRAKVDDFAEEFGIIIMTKSEPAAMPLPAVSTVPTKLTKAEKEAKASAAAEKLKATMGSKIPKATADQKDDLKLISGVGPFIEKKLNALGIYTFEQVSKFDIDLVNTTTDAIQFFPGRIQRDDWVGQAKLLHEKKTSDPSSLSKKHPSNPEDLKVVEGIGPKIEMLLKDGGIPNWGTLAETSTERLKEILRAAGDRYKMHNPASWAQQAELAHLGKWEELDKLQDYLIGGRDRS